MSGSLKIWTYVGFLLALVILVTVAVTSQHDTRDLIEAMRWVSHTHEVLNELEKASRAVKEIESGQRGYVITGNERYLSLYHEAQAQLADQVKRLYRLTADSVLQQQRLPALERLLAGRLSIAERTVAVRRGQGREAAWRFFSGNGGDEASSEIDRMIRSMKAEESRLLLLRTHRLESVSQATLTIETVLSGIALLLLIVVFAIMVVVNAQRERSTARLAAQYLVTRVLSEHQDTGQALHRVLKVVCESLDWDVGLLWRIDEESEVLRLGDIWCQPGLPVAAFETACRNITFGKGVGLPGRVWASGRPETADTGAEDASLPRRQAMKESGLISLIAWPINGDNGLIGVVEFCRRGAARPDHELPHMFNWLGAALGQFIERRRAEARASEEAEEAQRARVHLEAVLASIGEGLIQVDPEGKALDVNRAGAALLGYTSQEIAGRDLHDLLHGGLPDSDNHAGAACPLLAVIKTGGARQSLEDRFLRKDGSVFPVGYLVAPLVVAGRQIGAVMSFADISARKEAEKRVSEFYSAVSHELRSPLTSIRGSLGLIEGGMAGPVPGECLELVKIARTNCDRLIRLINQILDLKKIEAGKLELTITRIDPADLVSETIAGLQSMAEQARIRLCRQVSGGAQIDGDRDRLIQVLTNLVSNAIKFSPEQTAVTLAVASAAEGRLRFSVSDQGAGIPADQMHKLFGKFQQLDSSDSRQKGGTGLGLAISQKLVGLHGSKINVDTSPGNGSTFWFELPVAAASPAVREPEPEPKRGSTVLLIEDDDDLSLLLKKIVEAEGYTFTRAATISQAEEILASSHPDAIVLDIKLPDGSGLDLLDGLRQRRETEDIPVVVLTGLQPDGGSFGRPLLIDWLVKPLDPRKLLRSLRLATTRERPARVLIVDDDADTRKVVAAQLKGLGVECLEAADGAEAVAATRARHPDLIILDLAIPRPDGFEVVQILAHEAARTTPLIVYTQRDLTAADRERLTLGISRHFTKSRTSADEFVTAVRELLNGLISREGVRTDG